MMVVLYVIILFCSAIPALGLSEESAKEVLQKSAKLFDRGLYDEALKKLSSLNIPKDLDNSDDMKLAFKIRAISYAQTNNITMARTTIRELYFLDKEYRFDPFDTPAKAILLAEEEKSLITKKNERLREIIKEQQVPKNFLEQKPKSKSPKLFNAFLPFGINHWVQNNNIKANLYLATQTLGLLTNIGAYWWKHSYLQHFGLLKAPFAENRSRFQLAQTAQYVGFGLLALAYSISVLDAYMSLKLKSLHEES